MAEEDLRQLPRHVGIIMDGNGRWAVKRGLARTAGHKKGADAFGRIARHASACGIGHLTVYAFSTENWKRPPEEVGGIMRLLRGYLQNVDRYNRENMRVKVLGRREDLDQDILEKIEEIERRSGNNTGMVLNIALNYGGREEILRAVHAVVKRSLDGRTADLDELDENLFSDLLDTAGQPDVDLIVRTGGEMRVSNFLLWQGAYAEYVFTDVLWPDFSPKDLDCALEEYARRSRRLGGV